SVAADRWVVRDRAVHRHDFDLHRTFSRRRGTARASVGGGRSRAADFIIAATATAAAAAARAIYGGGRWEYSRERSRQREGFFQGGRRGDSSKVPRQPRGLAALARQLFPQRRFSRAPRRPPIGPAAGAPRHAHRALSP